MFFNFWPRSLICSYILCSYKKRVFKQTRFLSGQIYRDGIVIFKGEGPVGRLPGCPSQNQQKFNALAPFWLPTTGGDVTFVELVREGTYHPKFI